MAARTLILCTLVTGVAMARAESPSGRSVGRAGDVQASVQRRIAVIDLTNDQAVREVANRLLDRLASHVELAPPAISDAAALVDKLPPDDELRIIQAQRKRVSAEQNLAQRNFRAAAIDAVEGQELLLRVTPRAAIGLYAELALALGQSRLGEKKDIEAREAFALTHRLDPSRALDDLHYLPEVVQAFEAAKTVDPGMGTIVVRGAGRVWIDGDEVGSAPGEFRIPLGRHVVWLTGLLRDTAGKEVVVTATRPGDATIMDGPLTRPQKVARFRIALSQAQDPATLASAMTALASYVNVRDAVLLSMVNGKVMWQTWRDQAPGVSAIRELEGDGVREIVNQLAPPREPAIAPAPAEVVVERRQWYERRPVQVGLVATIVMAVVGGYLWAQYEEAPREWNRDITGAERAAGWR